MSTTVPPPDLSDLNGQKIDIDDVAMFGLNGLKATVTKASDGGNENSGHQTTTANDPRYSQERKNGATWTENETDIYKMNVKATSKAWKSYNEDEKNALLSYTASGYISINNALYQGAYAKGTTDSTTKGKIDNITHALNKTELSNDMWLQRRTSSSHLGNILGVSQDLCSKAMAGDAAAQKTLIETVTGSAHVQDGFQSFGSRKGAGLGGDVYINGYAPRGTKAVFAEPFSVHGVHHGKWKGSTITPSYCGGELETLVQRGATLHFTKVEFKDGNIYIDADVDTSTCPTD